MRSPTRFLYATGFSGHGFMQSPGVGKAVAELVVHGRSTLDLTEFSAERFTSGAPGPRSDHHLSRRFAAEAARDYSG